jgi:hypothetical protein
MAAAAPSVRLLRPDGHGIMQAIYHAYVAAAAEGPTPAPFLSKATALALLTDLGCGGDEVEAILRGDDAPFEVGGVWEGVPGGWRPSLGRPAPYITTAAAAQLCARHGHSPPA